MFPIVGIPETIAHWSANYRDIFYRDEGFEHVRRYLTGLLLSPNKTLQGIHHHQVCMSGDQVSRRSMHEAIFEAGWDCEALMSHHRQIISKDHISNGLEVISLDWTLGHHDRGKEIFGVKKRYDYVEKRYSLHQILLTAVASNHKMIDGLDVLVQQPKFEEEENSYLKASAEFVNRKDKDALLKRLSELLHYQKNRLVYKKRGELIVDLVQKMEEEGYFPTSHYTFDNGLLSIELSRCIESYGKNWVSELEARRLIQWKGQWLPVKEVAEFLKENHQESFPRVVINTRSGEKKECWVFTKQIRLKRYAKKRLVIVFYKSDLSDSPHFYLTNALHWEAKKVLRVWNYRWSSEIFHEFGKQAAGLESAQLRKEESVKRHLRLSCLAQSCLQRTPASASKSEKFEFAKGKITLGQRCQALARQAFSDLLTLVEKLFEQGKTREDILERACIIKTEHVSIR